MHRKLSKYSTRQHRSVFSFYFVMPYILLRCPTFWGPCPLFLVMACGHPGLGLHPKLHHSLPHASELSPVLQEASWTCMWNWANIDICTSFILFLLFGRKGARKSTKDGSFPPESYPWTTFHLLCPVISFDKFTKLSLLDFQAPEICQALHSELRQYFTCLFMEYRHVLKQCKIANVSVFL